MDELGRMDSPLHRLDARAKALATLVFIVTVMSFPRYAVSGLTPFLLYPVALVALGRLPVGAIAGKILIAAPLALAIGIFHPMLDRQPVAAVGPFVVSGGWLALASILLRFVLTVGAALALVACTGVYRLGAGLAQLGVPRVFVVQLLFLYRYLFVVSEQAGKMVRGVQFRSGQTRGLGLRVYGSLIGHLLLRSMDRADRVYRSMVARGFDGEVRVGGRTEFGWRDMGFVCGWAAFFLVARVWNLAAGLGHLFTGVFT